MIYRYDIEIHRGITALLIYFFHCKYIHLRGGYIGVDFFLILSGYLFLCNYSKFNHSRCFHSFKFLYTKVLRLIPLSHVILFIICSNYKMIYNNNPIVLLDDIKSALLLYSNYHFYFQNINYFNKGEETSFILHYWFLSVEIQFCCIASFTLLLPRILRYMFYKSIVVLSFLFNIYYSLFNSQYCYLSTFSRLWQILLFSYKINISKIELLQCSSYFIIILISFIYDSLIKYPGIYSILPTFLYYIVILKEGKISILQLSILGKIGNISYSFYLIHFILLNIFANEMLQEIAMLIVTYLLSCIAHYYFNYYFRKPNKLNTLILVVYIVLTYYFIYFISINKTKLIKGKIYSKNFHPSLFSGFTPLLELIKKEKCKERHSIKYKYFLLVGDSHMSQWLPVLINISKKISYLILFKWTSRNIILKNSNNHFSNIVKDINNTSIKFIIISFFTTKLKQNNLENNLLDIILLFKGISLNIYLIEDNPSHNRNPSYCLRSNNNRHCYGIVNINSSHYIYPKIKNAISNKYISFVKYYKIGNAIPYIYNNILIYIDNNHLSVDFALYFLPYFEKLLRIYNKIEKTKKCKLYYK